MKAHTQWQAEQRQRRRLRPLAAAQQFLSPPWLRQVFGPLWNALQHLLLQLGRQAAPASRAAAHRKEAGSSAARAVPAASRWSQRLRLAGARADLTIPACMPLPHAVV